MINVEIFAETVQALLKNLLFSSQESFQSDWHNVFQSFLNNYNCKTNGHDDFCHMFESKTFTKTLSAVILAHLIRQEQKKERREIEEINNEEKKSVYEISDLMTHKLLYLTLTHILKQEILTSNALYQELNYRSRERNGVSTTRFSNCNIQINLHFNKQEKFQSSITDETLAPIDFSNNDNNNNNNTYNFKFNCSSELPCLLFSTMNLENFVILNKPSSRILPSLSKSCNEALVNYSYFLRGAFFSFIHELLTAFNVPSSSATNKISILKMLRIQSSSISHDQNSSTVLGDMNVHRDPLSGKIKITSIDNENSGDNSFSGIWSADSIQVSQVFLKAIQTLLKQHDFEKKKQDSLQADLPKDLSIHVLMLCLRDLDCPNNRIREYTLQLLESTLIKSPKEVLVQIKVPLATRIHQCFPILTQLDNIPSLKTFFDVFWRIHLTNENTGQLTDTFEAIDFIFGRVALSVNGYPKRQLAFLESALPWIDKNRELITWNTQNWMTITLQSIESTYQPLCKLAMLFLFQLIHMLPPICLAPYRLEIAARIIIFQKNRCTTNVHNDAQTDEITNKVLNVIKNL